MKMSDTIPLSELVENVTNLTPDAAHTLLLDFISAARIRRTDTKRILILSGPVGSGKTEIARIVYQRITNRENFSLAGTSLILALKAREDGIVVMDNVGVSAYKRALALSLDPSEYVTRAGRKVDTSGTFVVITTHNDPPTSDELHDKALLLTLDRLWLKR